MDLTRPRYVTDEAIAEFIESALAEDIGEGDHSTLASVSSSTISRAQLLIKGDGVLAGVELAGKIFSHFDKRLQVNLFKSDGDPVHRSEIAFIVEGSAQSILSTERLVLNCMQRMSGIATYTSQLRSLIDGTSARLTDTRKTTPRFRLAEKWAVAIGGGVNHRFALYDMIMLKDNHVDLAGGIARAVSLTRQYLAKASRDLKIEVETRNLDEVKEALSAGVDIVMLDNMNIADMRSAVQLANKKALIEASGGITQDTIREVALCGVDYISVGALTHSVKSLDLSLKVIK